MDAIVWMSESRSMSIQRFIESSATKRASGSWARTSRWRSGWMFARNSTSLARGLDGDVLRNAMAYGTALASYNVERFGTEALASDQIDGAAVRRRVDDLWRFGRFDHLDVTLRD